nr:hypothetical protein TetV2_00621 [Oceanusvirus sp.]
MEVWELSKEKGCTGKTPLYNNRTGRCIQNTSANRKRVGVSTQKVKANVVDPKQKVKAAKPKQKAAAKSVEPKTKVKGKSVDPKTKVKGKSVEPKTKVKGKSVEPKTKVKSKPKVRSSEAEKEMMTRVMDDVQPFRRSEPDKPPAPANFASYLYRQIYGDKQPEHKMKFLDDMSMINKLKKSKWVNSGLQIALAMIYILRRHPQACLILDEDIATKYGGVFAMTWSLDDKAGGCFNLKNSFNFCRKNKKQFGIGIIKIIEHGIPHYNSFIYNYKSKKLEIFEPFGELVYIQELYDYVNKCIGQYVKINTLNQPNNICPVMGPQALEKYSKNSQISNYPNIGYCAAWSLYYIDARLSNPLVNEKDLMKTFMKKFETNATGFINAYSYFIVSLYDDLMKDPKYRRLSGERKERAIVNRLIQVSRNK